MGRGYFNVGMALEDVDRDGHKEIIVGKNINGKWALCWYKFGANLHDPWTEHILDGDARDIRTTLFLAIWTEMASGNW